MRVAESVAGHVALASKSSGIIMVDVVIAAVAQSLGIAEVEVAAAPV